MCTSQVSGFKIMVHNQSESAFPNIEGVNVAPGRATFIRLETVPLPCFFPSLS